MSGRAGPLIETLQILKINNIPLNRMVDARINPLLGQQIHTVVQRVAA